MITIFIITNINIVLTSLLHHRHHQYYNHYLPLYHIPPQLRRRHMTPHDTRVACVNVRPSVLDRTGSWAPRGDFPSKYCTDLFRRFKLVSNVPVACWFMIESKT